MMEEDKITTLMEEDDTLLPDGWQEGVDIFADEEWAGERLADGLDAAFDRDAEEHRGEEETAPTTERKDTSGDRGGDAAEDGTPTTESRREQPHRLKFRARVDRKDLDVELEESQLPDLYQKAQVTDRVQTKLARMAPQLERAEAMARSMGYAGLDAMVDAVGQKERSGGTAPEGEKETRSFRSEARALLEARPGLKGERIPDTVMRACADGKHLLVAYAEYEAEQQKAEAEKLRREIRVMKQNAAAAARAPVGSTRGGGEQDPFAGDDFLRGFEEE